MRDYAPSPTPLFRRTTYVRNTAAVLLIFLSVTAFAADQKNQPNPTAGKSKQSVAGDKASTATADEKSDQDDEKESKGPWKGLEYRLVGPFRGGRVVAVAGVVGQNDTYYFGSTAGGVWKTTDGGLNWRPIFDKQK